MSTIENSGYHHLLIMILFVLPMTTLADQSDTETSPITDEPQQEEGNLPNTPGNDFRTKVDVVIDEIREGKPRGGFTEDLKIARAMVFTDLLHEEFSDRAGHEGLTDLELAQIVLSSPAWKEFWTNHLKPREILPVVGVRGGTDPLGLGIPSVGGAILNDSGAVPNINQVKGGVFDPKKFSVPQLPSNKAFTDSDSGGPGFVFFALLFCGVTECLGDGNPGAPSSGGPLGAKYSVVLGVECHEAGWADTEWSKTFTSNISRADAKDRACVYWRSEENVCTSGGFPNRREGEKFWKDESGRVGERTIAAC